MKKALSLLIALVLTLSLSSALAADKITLDIWTFSGTLTNNMQRAIDWLKTEMPNVEVNLTSNAGPNHRQLMLVNAASDTMPDMWCMFGGTIGDHYTKNGLVYDLTQYAADHGWADKYLESVLQLCSLDGILAGYPASYASLAVAYRTDLFAQAGIEKTPTTMSELEDCLAKIKAIGVTPFAVGGATQANPMRLFQALLENYAGAEEHDALMRMETSWECDSVVKALEKFREWVELGYLPDGYLSINQMDNSMMMGAGMCAMTIDGPSMVSTLINNGYPTENFGFFKFPQDNGKRISAFGQMYMISKDVSQEKFDILMKLLDYCFGEENIAAIGDAFGYPLCTKNATMPATYAIAECVGQDVAEYGTYLISDQALPQSVVAPLYASMDYIGNGEMTAQEVAAYMQKCINDYKAGI